MDVMFHPEVGRRVAEGRESFSGRLLTDRQYNDFVALVGIIYRRIEETGSFNDPLTDYTNAVARSERFGPVKADTIVRDLFKIVTGNTMNEMREGFLEREKALFDREKNPAEEERRKAYQAGVAAARMVETGNKITFFRALNFEAVELAKDLNITHVGARKLINESFEEIEGRSLSDWGKELDEKYYRPQIEAEKKQRAAEKSQPRKQQPSYS